MRLFKIIVLTFFIGTIFMLCVHITAHYFTIYNNGYEVAASFLITLWAWDFAEDIIGSRKRKQYEKETN